MAERIYYRDQGQGSEPLEEELLGSENALQKVTADYRKFLNGKSTAAGYSLPSDLRDCF